MPSRYKFEDDGKIHTRFSELQNCVPYKIAQQVYNKINNIDIPQTEAVKFGIFRHNVLAEESRRTHRFPQQMIGAFPWLDRLMADMVEEEMVTEIFQDIVLHSTPDVVNFQEGLLIDYKTSSARLARDFARSMQLLVYAYQLRLRGIEIKEIGYLVEIWNRDRTKFVGYDYWSRRISLYDIAKVRTWLQKRCELLQAAISAYQKGLLN